MKSTIHSLSLACLIIVSGCETTPGGSRHERHAAVVVESGKVGTVAGGESFQAVVPYDKAYDAVLTFLKRKDWIIETASKDTGQIATAHQITGGWHQTGTRVVVTLIKESDTATTVKVAVTEQRRYKALQTEPWDDAVVNAEKSAALAQEIKPVL